MTDSQLLQEIHEQFSAMVRDFGLLKQAVMGNGVKGLVERVEEIERWIKTHPANCPFLRKRADILKTRAFEVAVIAVVLTALELFLKAVHVL